MVSSPLVEDKFGPSKQPLEERGLVNHKVDVTLKRVG
jgi:hypothetical protein